MATLVVAVDGKYTMRVVPPVAPATTTEYVGGQDLFFEKRPDRVRMRKPTGWLYPKPYAMELRKHRLVSGTVRSENQSDGTQYSFQGFLGSFVDGGQTVQPPLPDSNLRRASIIKALGNLKDQKVNLGVALAEAQQTADFLGSSAMKLGRAAKHMFNGNPKRALKTLGASNWRDYPKGWLGYNYAAMPLLSDIYGSCEALAFQRLKFSDWVVTVKGSARSDRRVETSFNPQPNHFGGALHRDRHRVGYFTRLDYYPGNTFLSSLSSAGVTNPLEIIWEKVPFSFVVDWIVPVGEWLSTMDAAAGYVFLSGSTTERIESTRLTGLGNEAVRAPYRCKYAKFEGYQRFLSVKREVHASSPLVSRPRIKNPLSLGHMANGLSLLTAVFGGRR